MAYSKHHMILFAVLAVALGAVVFGGYYLLHLKAIQASQTSWLYPEKAQKLVFAPAPSALGERARFTITQSIGADVLSTTLPISITLSAIPLLEKPQEQAPINNPENLEIQGEMHGDVGISPATGAYLIRFENSQLCNEQGACPTALMSKSADSSQPSHLGQLGEVIFQTTAKHIWLSNKANQGNPDLFIDYGVEGMPPVRMYWDEDAQYPSYISYPPSSDTLPKLN
jgi:hypothetical protein